MKNKYNICRECGASESHANVSFEEYKKIKIEKGLYYYNLEGKLSDFDTNTPSKRLDKENTKYLAMFLFIVIVTGFGFLESQLLNL